jgi:hypothetical protein
MILREKGVSWNLRGTQIGEFKRWPGVSPADKFLRLIPNLFIGSLIPGNLQSYCLEDS